MLARISSDAMVRSPGGRLLGRIGTTVRSPSGAMLGRIDTGGAIRDRSGGLVARISDGEVRSASGALLWRIGGRGVVRDRSGRIVARAEPFVPACARAIATWLVLF